MTNAPRPRRSFFGPLLLIAIGALLLMLQMGLLPVENTFRLVATYWPAILILWGVAKLIDQISARAAGEAPPPALSGGEVVLLIFVLMFGIVLSGAKKAYDEHGDKINWPWDHYYTFTQELPPHPLPRDAHIVVRTDRGDITLIADDGADLRVTARKEVRASSESAAAPRAEEITAAIRPSGDTLEITPQRAGTAPLSYRVHFDVRVPRHVRATLHTSMGSAEVRGVNGDVTIEARGALRVHDLGGNLRATVRGSGGIEVSGVKGEAIVAGEVFGTIRLQNVARAAQFTSRRTQLSIGALPGRAEIGDGRVTVENASGGVSLTTHSNDITFSDVSGRLLVNNRRGDVVLRLPQAPADEIEVNNERGSVELFLPPAAAFEISALSRRGDVRTDFSGPELTLREDDRGREGSLQGKIGARGPRIVLNTTYGTIRLGKY